MGRWWVAVMALALVVGVGAGEATAQQGERVEITLTVDHRPADDDERREVVVQRREEINEMVVRRIETRLEAIGVKYWEIDVGSDHTIEITVYGDFDGQVVRGAIIPRGRMELRRVKVDDSPWAHIAAELPEGVELEAPRQGVFRTDQLFLTAPSPAVLQEVIDEYGPSNDEVHIFPQEDGFRTVRLGRAVASESHVRSGSLGRSPAGDPRIDVRLESAVAHEALSGQDGTSHLAMVLDGEVVALIPTRQHHRSATFDIDPPPHLTSREAKQAWAMQVAGRLSAPMPIRLIEFDDLQQ